MRLYSVHLGPATPQGREVVLVKEGFSWPAFLFTFFWALVKGWWLTAILIFTAQAGLSAASYAAGFSAAGETIVSFAVVFLIGAFANDLQRLELSLRNFREAGVVAGHNLGAAELRAFERIPALSA
jgi:Protein of unknown function (DUF2628)